MSDADHGAAAEETADRGDVSERTADDAAAAGVENDVPVVSASRDGGGSGTEPEAEEAETDAASPGVPVGASAGDSDTAAAEESPSKASPDPSAAGVSPAADPPAADPPAADPPAADPPAADPPAADPPAADPPAADAPAADPPAADAPAADAPAADAPAADAPVPARHDAQAAPVSEVPTTVATGAPPPAAAAASPPALAPHPPREGTWWLGDLLAAVKRRNACGAVTALVSALEVEQKRTAKLRKDVTGLQRENDELVRGGGAGGGDGGGDKGATGAMRKYISELQEENAKLKDRSAQLEGRQSEWVDAAGSALHAQQKMDALKGSMAEMRIELDRLIPKETEAAQLGKELSLVTAELQQLRKETEGFQAHRKTLADENLRLRDATVAGKQREAEYMNELLYMERRALELVDTIRHLETTGGGGGGGGGHGDSLSAPPTASMHHFNTAQDAGHVPAVQVPQVLKRTTPKAHVHDVNALDVAPGGRHYATGASDKFVKIWDATTSSEHACLNAAVSAVLRVQYNPTGDLLAAGTSDGSVVLWNTQTHRHLTSLCGHSQKITGVCFDVDRTLLTTSGDRTLRRWDLVKNECTTIKSLWSNAVDAAAGGSLVASAHHDGGLRFWDHRTLNAAEEMKAVHTQPLTSVCFSSDSNRVLTTSKDGSVKLIDTRTFNVQTSIELRYFSSMQNAAKACFSPDDAFIAVGLNTDTERGGVVQVYDTKSRPKMRAQLAQTGGHTGQVSQVCWAADGATLLSAALDGSVVTWGPS